MKAALVTGCSAGGTGYAIVKSFQRRGFHVFATARDLSKMTGLEKLANVTLLKLEITSSDDIKAAVAAVEKSGHSLEYLVNNAGAAPCMPALDVDIAGGHAVFETNFWGTLSMCQAFVPMLIEQKGCIVTINSVNSFLYPTWMSMLIMPGDDDSSLVHTTSNASRSTDTVAGMYNAAKAAQRAMLETMRAELEPLGVRVLTVVAGALDTQIMSRQAGTFTLPEHSLYKSIEAQIRFRSEGEEKVPRMNADTFAEVSAC